jgi:hypothetical protein
VVIVVLAKRIAAIAQWNIFKFSHTLLIGTSIPLHYLHTIVESHFITYIFIERYLKYTIERLLRVSKIIHYMWRKLGFGVHKY